MNITREWFLECFISTRCSLRSLRSSFRGGGEETEGSEGEEPVSECGAKVGQGTFGNSLGIFLAMWRGCGQAGSSQDSVGDTKKTCALLVAAWPMLMTHWWLVGRHFWTENEGNHGRTNAKIGIFKLQMSWIVRCISGASIAIRVLEILRCFLQTGCGAAMPISHSFWKQRNSMFDLTHQNNLGVPWGIQRRTCGCLDNIMWLMMEQQKNTYRYIAVGVRSKDGQVLFSCPTVSLCSKCHLSLRRWFKIWRIIFFQYIPIVVMYPV